MSKKNLALIANFFFSGIGTLMIKKTVTGTVQLIISLICVLGMVLTLGLGGIILVPLAIINCIWAVLAVSNASETRML